MEFIIDNWFLVVVAAAVVAAVIVAVVKFGGQPSSVQLQKVREWLVFATIQAEKELGSGTGRLKLRMVYDLFVTKFPWLAKALSFEGFSDLVDDALTTTNDMLMKNNAVQLYVNGPAEESGTAEG